MKWKNVIKDGTPADQQDVLIAIKGIYYSATYIASENGFKIRETSKFIQIKNDPSGIYWSET